MIRAADLIEAGIVEDEIEALNAFPIEMLAEFSEPIAAYHACDRQHLNWEDDA